MSGASLSRLGPFDWSFGDGAGAVGTEVSHTFEQAGEYTLTACADGCAGGPLCRSTLVRVCDLPEVVFEAEDLGAGTWLFRDLTSEPLGCVSDRQWDLFEGDATGDPGERLYGPSPQWTAPHGGEWTVVLNVGSPAGTAAATMTLDVAIRGCDLTGGPGLAGGWLAALLAYRRRRSR